MLRWFVISYFIVFPFAGTVAAEPLRTPDTAATGLDVHEHLEVSLFAAEPLLLSPANIDVDHRGRVWVCEIVNYRHFANKDNPPREAGDRIIILKDTDGDSQADTRTVFYQGHDIDSPHGVCVLGNNVIVSANDKVFVLTDDDGDDRADRKTVLFSGISGTQHDHGIHAFVFGPDGRLYFNFGNEGRQLKDRYGSPIVDTAGNVVNDQRQPYQQGMVFRCNMDGSQVETLAWNFRNNWEICVDSFGTLWQSDNDDDGNRGTRINFVMEYGNYGYRDEMTGAGWRTVRTGMHETIPLRHWHLRDPGVVPNLLQTGAGSPAGMCLYEGLLLPSIFHSQMLHCDPGPNIVRAYPVRPAGAGYSAELVEILHGARDNWFRPTDVCVAPDGSLIVADWYDPGVGGHRMGDIERGRLFRVAPPESPYQIPAQEFSTVDGAITALKSPNHETRYRAWTALHNAKSAAEPALKNMFTSSNNPRFRARALWLLGHLEGRAQHYIETAVRDRNPDIRIVGLRIARQQKRDVVAVVESLIRDSEPRVRRECAIALRHERSQKVPSLWAELALQHDGDDRWYLEALGIAAGIRWDACFEAWLARVGESWNTPAGRDIIWRSRASKTPAYLARVIRSHSDPRTLPRYLRAFDFLDEQSRRDALVELAYAETGISSEVRSFVTAEAINRLQESDVTGSPQHRSALNQVLDAVSGTQQFVTLVDRFSLSDRYPGLVQIARQKPDEQAGVEAVRVLLEKGQQELLRQALLSNDPQQATATTAALANTADARVTPLLLEVVKDPHRPVSARREGVRGAARTRDGGQAIVDLARSGSLDERLQAAAASALHGTRYNKIKEAAAALFPLPPSKDNRPLPPISELTEMKGDANQGRLLFNTTGTCHKCHVVNGIGREAGPNLSEIGNKLSREALFHSILFPSAGISHNYETWSVLLDDGTVVNGLIISQTDDAVTLRDSEAIVRQISRDRIDELVKQDVSLMPADLQKILSAQELADIVQYMTQLKKAKAPAG